MIPSIPKESLCLEATLDALEPARAYVKDVTSLAGLTKRATFQLLLAIDELVTNIVVYGYAHHTGHIVLQTHISETTLSIVIEDTAVPFDPHTLIMPDVHQPLETRKIGGLGVWLILNNLDQFDYEYVNGHNRNICTMKRP